MSDEIPHFTSLDAANKWLEEQAPPGAATHTETVECVALGEPRVPWKKMTESRRSGWIREVDSRAAGALAMGEWAKTIHAAFDEGGASYVVSQSWRGSAAVHRVPLAERRPGEPIAVPAAAPLNFRPVHGATGIADVNPLRSSNVPLVPAADAPADSVAMLVERMKALCTNEWEINVLAAAVYKETMGAEAQPIEAPAEQVGAWRQAIAYYVTYIEAASTKTMSLLRQIQGI